ncbi:sensor histidine kinase [Polyangium aurulentum]|uniref:sensor histidine kinase n=1 Tax=Polyangium aurulentum TaxID=2567896 RepID=UPI00146AF409|nr:ATP-binding protein [Polyangium aurulentum]UQA59030.1 PAS domain-containing protein [Polyangium aurulentum]
MLSPLDLVACLVDARSLDVAWMSPRAASLFGPTSDGAPLSFLVQEEQPSFRALLDAVRRDGSPRTRDLGARRADGQSVWLRLEASAWKEKSGSPRWLLVTMTDISDLGRDHALRVVVDDVDSIVWEFDLSTMCFTFVSRQAERILGYPIDRWLHDPKFWVEHMHSEDRAWAPAYCESETKRLSAHEFEYRMVAADGSVVWFRDIVTVVVDHGRPGRLRGVMVDITRSKQAEAERDQLLAQEQKARADVEAARERVEEALRRRDEFISAASHELRTPLTPLRLQIQSLLRAADRGEIRLPESQRTKLEIARRQVERLASLVGGLLDVSRVLEAGIQLEVEPFDLRELAREVIESLHDQSTRAGSRIVLLAGAPAIGVWDRAGLEKVTGYLLSNALKYGLGKPIEVSIRTAASGVTLEVRDQGIGIAPEDHDRIFERYERAPSSRGYGGLGLGLHAARALIEAHGGRIAVRSELGKGATFVVTLPPGPKPVER